MGAISNQPGGPNGNGIYRYANSVWTQLPGAGVTIAASVDAGSYADFNISPGGFYVTNTQGGIFYYNPATGFTPLPGAVVSLAPTASGGLFAIGVLYVQSSLQTPNRIFYNNLTTGTWTIMPGAAVSIAVSTSALFAVGVAGGIYQSGLVPITMPSPSPSGP